LHAVEPGRRLIFTEGELTDAVGRVVAPAASSLLVLAPTDGVKATGFREFGGAQR